MHVLEGAEARVACAVFNITPVYIYITMTYILRCRPGKGPDQRACTRLAAPRTARSQAVPALAVDQRGECGHVLLRCGDALLDDLCGEGGAARLVEGAELARGVEEHGEAARAEGLLLGARVLSRGVQTRRHGRDWGGAELERSGGMGIGRGQGQARARAWRAGGGVMHCGGAPAAGCPTAARS